MIGERTFTEELMLNGFKFANEASVTYYAETESKNLRFVAKNYTEGIAFISDRWRRSFQSNRKRICKMTWHGYHHWMCMVEGCFEPEEECVCKFCGGTRIGRYHALDCEHLTHLSLRDTIDELGALQDIL